MNMDAVPNELKSLRRWITWRMEDGAKKPNCRWQDSANWRTFDEVANEPLIGFVFAVEDGFVGIDLDDCFENGNLSDFAREVLNRFEATAYAEVSPSGTGIKLWTRGRKPDGCRSVNRAAGLEVYGEGRWFAVTGRVILGMEDIGDGQAGIDWLVQHYLSAQHYVTTDEPKQNVEIIPRGVRSKGIRQRAIDYIEHSFKPTPGDRNNSAFRLAGHLYAMVEADGERLGKQDVLEFVFGWNSRLPAPLDHKEVQTIVESASKNGTARADKEAARPVEDASGVDLSGLIKKDREVAKTVKSEPEEWDESYVEPETDEEFCERMVPKEGLVRDIYNYYWKCSMRKSSVMGMAVSLSICETIFGRRIASETNMRTNDYNLILATTSSGKEICESVVTNILEAADPSGSIQHPPDVQSGNGLMHMVAANPCGIWVADEFGKTLQAVFDKKGNQHLKNIGTHLLKLYSKSNGAYQGAAHSNGVRNKVRQPHLVILGMSTGSTVFGSIGTNEVSDGLFGRIAFWPVQERPDPDDDIGSWKPSEDLVHRVSQWIKFQPGGNLGSEYPQPVTLAMDDAAKLRWKSHERQIVQKMRIESELVAAIWGRTAGRSMKLALVHRAARMNLDPSATLFEFQKVELVDVEWGICMSNWLTRTAVDLAAENFIDASKARAKAILAEVTKDGPVSSRALLRKYRSLTSGDFTAAAIDLGIEIVETPSKRGGSPRKIFSKRRDSASTVPPVS